MIKRLQWVLLVCLSTLVICAVCVAGAGAAKPRVKVIASGLSQPKHLLYTARGLYVVESGTGGPAGKRCVSAPPLEGSGTTQDCEGPTGAVALIKRHHLTIAKGGLASVIEAASDEASGPASVTVNGRGRISVLYQDALVNANGTNSLPAPASTIFGTFQIAPGVSANIAAFDAQHPELASTLGGIPGETTYDCDPYDVVRYRGGFAVADAGANSLLAVSAKGNVSLLARFGAQAETVPAGVFGPTPVPIDAQAVPTSVAVGPDGALYVGLLRGVPSEPGTAQIYRVLPGHAPTVWASGLTAVTDIAFDRKHRLLAVEYSAGGLLAAPKVPGALVRVSANGKHVTTLPVKGLLEPAGVAVARDGAVFVANDSTSSGSAKPSGEVLEITGLG